MLRVQFEEDLEKLHNQFYAMGMKCFRKSIGQFVPL